MSGELVKYDNQFNDVAFRNFNGTNQNLFMGIVSRMRDKNTEQVKFSYTTLRKLCGIEKKMSNTEFSELIQDVYNKMLGLQIVQGNPKKGKAYVLFPTFEWDQDAQTLIVAVNPNFAHLLNNFTNFTEFELKQFVGLQGKYSKVLYRKLKQFKSTGYYTVDLEEFRRLFDVPQKYTPKKIKQKIIDPVLIELSDIFPGLSVEVVKLPQKGAPVGRYIFRYNTKGNIENQLTFDDIAIAQKEGFKKKIIAKKKKKDVESSVHNFQERDYSVEDYGKIEKILAKK